MRAPLTRQAMWRDPARTAAALALSGFAFGRASVAARDDYDAGLLDACPSGCAAGDVPAHVLDDRDRAELFNAFEITGYAVGGAAVVTGVVLLVLNTERPVLIEPSDETLTAVPMIAPQRLGMTVQLRL